jgi:hypothetical protein
MAATSDNRSYSAQSTSGFLLSGSSRLQALGSRLATGGRCTFPIRAWDKMELTHYRINVKHELETSGQGEWSKTQVVNSGRLGKTEKPAVSKSAVKLAKMSRFLRGAA